MAEPARAPVPAIIRVLVMQLPHPLHLGAQLPHLSDESERRGRVHHGDVRGVILV